jgi:UDP-N-acetylmuramoyl-tripeptide--D-alanyl-D-alanine ligase
LIFTVEEIAKATRGRVQGPAERRVRGVTTDSRRAGEGELFVPLRGERFDGHDFISSAADAGTRVFLVEADWLSRNDMPAGATAVAVEDTLRALGDLAAFHRQRFLIPVVGVTGSNGKTTVKEMIASILARTGPVLKTAGNLNNLIGLPQMLLQLNGSHRWGVLEMGMSEPGEIDRLAEIAAPRAGVITNAYAAHLESMGSVEAVARAKGELFQRLPAGGWAVYNADDPLISRLPSPEGVERLSFGLQGAEISASNIERLGRSGQRFAINIKGEVLQISLRAFGLHNVMNSLAAAATAYALGVSPEGIREGLEQFTPYDRRFSLEELDGIVLIDDSYNANPASMKAALETVRELREECRAVAVLGDMLELGEITRQAHFELGKMAASCVDTLYVTGEMAGAVADGAREGGLPDGEVVVSACHGEIIADLKKRLTAGDLVLVKGSRGMAMEKVAEGLRIEFAGNRPEGRVA